MKPRWRSVTSEGRSGRPGHRPGGRPLGGRGRRPVRPSTGPTPRDPWPGCRPRSRRPAARAGRRSADGVGHGVDGGRVVEVARVASFGQKQVVADQADQDGHVGGRRSPCAVPCRRRCARRRRCGRRGNPCRCRGGGPRRAGGRDVLPRRQRGGLGGRLEEVPVDGEAVDRRCAGAGCAPPPIPGISVTSRPRWSRASRAAMAGGPVASTRTSGCPHVVGPRVGGRGRAAARASRELRPIGSSCSAATAATRSARPGSPSGSAPGPRTTARPRRLLPADRLRAIPGSTATGTGPVVAGAGARRPPATAGAAAAVAGGPRRTAPPDVVGHPGDGPSRLGDRPP